MKLIDPLAASHIVLQQLKSLHTLRGPLKVNDFIADLLSSGLLPRSVSHRTITDLLNGRMYPDLKLPDGSPVPWGKLRSVKAGRGRKRKLITMEEFDALVARVAKLEEAASWNNTD